MARQAAVSLQQGGGSLLALLVLLLVQLTAVSAQGLNSNPYAKAGAGDTYSNLLSVYKVRCAVLSCL